MKHLSIAALLLSTLVQGIWGEPFILNPDGSFGVITIPGVSSAFVTGINNEGGISGNFFDAAGNLHGFVTLNGVLTTVNFPGAQTTQVTGLNDKGDFVGYDLIPTTMRSQRGQFEYTNGVYVTLPPLPDLSTTPNGINNAGQIVGTACGPSFGCVIDTAYVYASGSFTILPRVGMDVEGTGINNAGEIVGSVFPVLGSEYGFLDVGGMFTTIAVPDASSTFPSGINDLGQIVGTFETPSGEHGFLYSNGVYTTIDFPGAASTELNGINNSGEIVGNFSGGIAGKSTSTPEPNSIVMFACGLAAISLIRVLR